MLGFQMVPVPPVLEVIDLVTGETCRYREWSQHEVMHGLDSEELAWVTDVANFKTCFRMVSSLPTKAKCQECQQPD